MKHLLKVSSLQNLPETRPLVAVDNEGNLFGEKESSQQQLINFTIDGTPYQAENGMIWSDWATNPTYNTDGWFIQYNLIYKNTDGWEIWVCYENEQYEQRAGEAARSSEQIRSGYSYYCKRKSQ